MMFAFLLALAVYPAHAQMVEDYRFKGRVLDEGGKPIAEAKITLRNLEDGSRIEFKTDKDGTFDRRMIPAARYEATIAKDGFAPQTQTFDWSASTNETEIVEVQIVLSTEKSKVRQEMGKKAAALYEESYAALQQNDCPTATTKARQILDMGAGDYEYAVRFIIARCHAIQDQPGEAITEYEKVLALRPDFFEARFDLAAMLEKQGQHDAAIEQYEQAAALKPDDVEVQYNVGALLLQRQLFDRARTHLQRAVEIDSTHALAAKGLGFAYLQGESKDTAAARRYLERYLALQPDATDATEIRALIAEIKKGTTQ
ncbi:MAG TPA: tetratricopeptide repeat protein [Candidatus Krumholzibacteria bacterium]